MNRQATGLVASGGIMAALLAGAFVAAPHSCDGGLEAYFWAGIVTLIALIAIAFFSRTDSSLLVRFAWAAGFALLGAGVWLGGLVVANVKLLCRLF